jgi:hypothetical protein
MTPSPSASPSPPPALPFAPAPSRVKFHLEDTLISPDPSPPSSAYNSDSDVAPRGINHANRSSLRFDEKSVSRPQLSSRVDSADDAPGTLPDEYYDAVMAPWRAAIRRRLVKNLKKESEWIGSMQVARNNRIVADDADDRDYSEKSAPRSSTLILCTPPHLALILSS